MTKGKKGPGHGLGKAFVNDSKKQKAQHKTKHVFEDGPGHVASILNQTSLDDFLTTAAMARQTFEAQTGQVDFASEKKLILKNTLDIPRPDLEEIVVPIPKRPEWTRGMEPEELHQAEHDAFLQWRRELAEMEESLETVMTPFERNVDFWRQLWRVVERSDVVVQIVDARSPLFYRSRDLEAYVTGFEGKKAVLVLNKADLLTQAERDAWSNYFREQGIQMFMFSALAELDKKELLEKGPETEEGKERADVAAFSHVNVEGATDLLDCETLFDMLEAMGPDDGLTTIGMVGYPNVGKSSLINALCEVKKVSMSKQPGKTKHFQTIDVPQRNIRLCDCPGLVFPSVVASKSHLVIRGVQPIDVCRDNIAACELVVGKVGIDNCLKQYYCVEQAKPYLHESPARILLSAYAIRRGKLLKLGQPDLQWSSRVVLRDFTNGALLHVELPEGVVLPRHGDELEQDEMDTEEAAAAMAAKAEERRIGAEKALGLQENVREVDEYLDDIDAFETNTGKLNIAVAGMSKRKLRQMQKGMRGGKLLARKDGALDPFTNQKERIGSVAMGFEALRVHQSGRKC